MRRWGSRSLRLRLTVVTAGLLCVTLVVGALVLTSVLSASRIAGLDRVAEERAATIAVLVVDDRVPPALPVSEPGEIAQVLDAEGRVVATSPNASRTLPVLPPDAVAAVRRDLGEGPNAATTDASAYDGPVRAAVIRTTYGGEPVDVVVTVPLGEVRGLLDALRVSLLLVVPVLTLVLAAAIWAALGRALLPVEDLRRAAAQVARSGGPGSLPVHRADDELGALARTLNEMLDRLERSAARQRTFVADAAHELRSPIAALRAGIEVAQVHPDAYRAPELAAELEGEVLRMGALVDDLLLLARVGSTPVVRTDVDLGAVARSAAATARAAWTTGAGATAPEDTPGGSAPAVSVALRVDGAGHAHGDAAAVGRVVRNLVDNALRHARSHVRVTVAPGSVVVEDDGAGIPVEDRERVFERFVRLQEARGRELGGSGLGLAIAREIARDHGGDVTLSASDAGGLRGTLTLPEGPPDDPRQGPDPRHTP